MDLSFEPFQIVVISAALVASALIATAIFLQLARKTTQQRRKADRAPVDRAEAKVFARARQLFKERKIVQAAQLLESIGRQREAVQMLEEGSRIDEAANMLIRMDRPNRAGVMYARHGMWAKAAECFRAANMPLEVARCAREQSDFKTAAKYFLQSEHYAEAAECFADSGDLRNAAKNYAKSGYDRKAADLYIQLLDTKTLAELGTIEEDELNFFVEQLSRGNGPISFARVLDKHQRLHEAIYNLLRYGNYTDAARHLANPEQNYTDKLNTLVSGHEYASQNLARAYDINSQFTASGKLFEMLGQYSKATVSYIKAGLKADADRCKALAINVEKAKSEDTLSFTDTHADETLVMNVPQKDTVLFLETRVSQEPEKKNAYESIARKITLFSDLTLEERLMILSTAKERPFEKGELLAKEQSSPSGIFIVAEGEVRVSEGKNNSTEFRKELQAGEVFGESWTFFDELLSASYQAKTAGKIIEITKDDFTSLLDKNSTLARRLYKSLLRQWRLQAISTRNDYDKRLVS